MKNNNILKFTFVAIVFSLIMSACEEDEAFDFSKPFNNTLTGDIIADMHLVEGDYQMKSVTRVKDGATLTIEAGSIITASEKIIDDNGTVHYTNLIIERGGKLVINGTSDKPVTFTCANEEAGSWGGIIINGKAPVDNATGEELEYGGDMADDNSGMIKHLKIEYAGESSEMFALTMNAVGSETVIENVQVMNSLGTGFGLNESTVVPSNLSVIGSYIGGNITKDMYLATGSYFMQGSVNVKEGATLTIHAGAVITVIKGEWPASLIIEKGGKLNVNGTQTNPIVFTSAEQEAGSWGGIVLNGMAPVSKVHNAYGGDDESDNSGSIQYLRIEYAGLDTENAFAANAVGSETIIENVEVYYCGRSAFGFTGGTVNARYLMASGVGNTMFKWDFGWQGKGQFWLGYRNSADVTLGEWAGGIVGDGGLDDNGEAILPLSNPTLSNITIVNNDDTYGIVSFRYGTKGLLRNLVLVDNPKKGFQVWDDLAAGNINSGLLDIDYASTMNLGNHGYNGIVLPENRFEASENFIQDDAEISLNGFVGTTANGTDMSLVDAWFESTNYKGAVASDNNWTEGWTK
ncbi:hypothetical protein [Labilibacter marinus]|uniref:hypothetical protein n=1 Tax=Labilibacter marinus TaxID=1477105 RepID=UPI000ACC9430|nr:hypothetical protein [Labilibacter marinus]